MTSSTRAAPLKLSANTGFAGGGTDAANAVPAPGSLGTGLLPVVELDLEQHPVQVGHPLSQEHLGVCYGLVVDARSDLLDAELENAHRLQVTDVVFQFLMEEALDRAEKLFFGLLV